MKREIINPLKTLFFDIYGTVDSKGKMARLTELGQLLAKEVGRAEPWTSHHLNAVMMGYKNFRMAPDLEMAINVLAGKRDEGTHPLQAFLVRVDEVYSLNGNLQSGDIVTGHRQRCKGCLTWFVPHHNLQRYCCKECPQRPRKAKAKSERI